MPHTGQKKSRPSLVTLRGYMARRSLEGIIPHNNVITGRCTLYYAGITNGAGARLLPCYVFHDPGRIITQLIFRAFSARFIIPDYKRPASYPAYKRPASVLLSRIISVQRASRIVNVQRARAALL